MGSGQNLSLYIALTGDNLKEQSFWEDFKKLPPQRHAAVHKGVIVTRDEAEKSVKAARKFVEHLKSK